jgi:hypothetical protein|tara:strand:+ start:406 stop:636 length:231 start_codon:yes stop_codon:yes gene_type:complete
VAKNIKPKLIGRVSSDSGVISVLDHTHLYVNECGRVNLPRYNLYTAIDTEIGDGEFKIYELRDTEGKLRRIVITID